MSSSLNWERINPVNIIPTSETRDIVSVNSDKNLGTVESGGE